MPLRPPLALAGRSPAARRQPLDAHCAHLAAGRCQLPLAAHQQVAAHWLALWRTCTTSEGGMLAPAFWLHLGC